MNEYLKKVFKQWILLFGILFFIGAFFMASYNAWKDENKEKLQLISLLNGEAIKLSKEAEELLIEAAKDRFGLILMTKSTNGTNIQTNSKSFIEESNARSMAK